jgi:hypothetical protein
MHLLAVILVAAAGAAYCLAFFQRWRSLGRPGEDASRRSPMLWIGLALHAAAVAAACGDRDDRDFLYAVLGAWAGIAAALFASRFIAGPSRGLLALPVGCMALLVAMTALAVHPEHPPRGGGAIAWLHAGFMTAYLGAVLAAGSTAALYLVAARQLKSASRRALKLPQLPGLERLTERALIVATAMLMAGVATGGAVMEQVPGSSLAQPTIAIALVNLVLLLVVLAAHAAGRLSRRGLARAAAWCMAMGAVELISLQVSRHG